MLEKTRIGVDAVKLRQERAHRLTSGGEIRWPSDLVDSSYVVASAVRVKLVEPSDINAIIALFWQGDNFIPDETSIETSPDRTITKSNFRVELTDRIKRRFGTFGTVPKAPDTRIFSAAIPDLVELVIEVALCQATVYTVEHLARNAKLPSESEIESLRHARELREQHSLDERLKRCGGIQRATTEITKLKAARKRIARQVGSASAKEAF